MYIPLCIRNFGDTQSYRKLQTRFRNGGLTIKRNWQRLRSSKLETVRNGKRFRTVRGELYQSEEWASRFVVVIKRSELAKKTGQTVLGLSRDFLISIKTAEEESRQVDASATALRSLFKFNNYTLFVRLCFLFDFRKEIAHANRCLNGASLGKPFSLLRRLQ